ncbi:MAG: TolC family protein [Methylobacter sp.]|jgi:cobalt-zinc-cadmium efflux system outer membrane protein|nr:TolC family protein [Methylobacter sp.]
MQLLGKLFQPPLAISRHFSLILALSAFWQCSLSAEILTLPHVLSLLETHNPSLANAQARQESAQAAWVTSRAYPNPELEIGGGSSTGIGPGSLNGPNEQAYISQPLDLPFVREARRKVAEAGITSADEASRHVWLTVRSQTRMAFYEILRRQAELQISRDNEQLLTQIRDKIKLKVEVGEAPRYEQVKSEAEALNALKLRESAETRVEDAKSALRMMFGPALPHQYEAAGDLPAPPASLPSLDNLREEVLDKQPILQQFRAEIQKAQAKVTFEQHLRYPQPTLKAGVQQDPGLKQWQINIIVPLPLWNQRQGPIGEAAAELKQAEALARQQEFQVIRELENAYNRYLIAHRQVETFKAGLLKEAETVLKVAEAAYRLGERSIIDYLDAQRTYRTVRNDYINARFDRQIALIDLERLRATDLEELPL